MFLIKIWRFKSPSCPCLALKNVSAAVLEHCVHVWAVNVEVKAHLWMVAAAASVHELIQYRYHCNNTVKPCVAAPGCVCPLMWQCGWGCARTCVKDSVKMYVWGCRQAGLVSFLFFVPFVDHTEEHCHSQYNRRADTALSAFITAPRQSCLSQCINEHGC